MQASQLIVHPDTGAILNPDECVVVNIDELDSFDRTILEEGLDDDIVELAKRIGWPITHTIS